MRKGKKDIFISYCRKSGGLETAERIRDRLIFLGYTVFMDLHNIELGEEFPATIVEAIKSCKEILLILPPNIKARNGNISNALENKWVKYEICYALKYNKRIIPILMEGYVFPEEDFDSKLPEEFQESQEIIEKYKNIGKKNGIRIKNEYFEDNFKELRRSLKSHRKWKIKKRISVSTCAILLLLGILMIGKCIYNSYLPLFSLSLVSEEESDDENNNQSWNMKYFITNKGGELIGGSVIPSLQIELRVVSKHEGYDYKYGFFDIEFYDYYKGSYFFNDQNNTVSIYESKADTLVEFIYLIEEQLEKNDMYIDMYAIKQFFEIHYTDYFGLNHREFLALENNYNYIFTNWGQDESQDNDEGLVRYCSDNALVRVKQIDDSLIAHSLSSDESAEFAWYIKDDAEYIKEHQNELLKTSVYSVIEAEDMDGNIVDETVKTLGNAVNFVKDEDEFAIGVHTKHENCNYDEDLEWYERVKNVVNDILR